MKVADLNFLKNTSTHKYNNETQNVWQVHETVQDDNCIHDDDDKNHILHTRNERIRQS